MDKIRDVHHYKQETTRKGSMKIEVVVEYEPEVSVEEMFIHSKEGDTVELVCVVHARPKAEVRLVAQNTQNTSKW